KALGAERAGDAARAREAFLKSYGYYGIARHPFPSTPGKHHGYRKTREMFLAASKYFDIAVERVAIPLGDKTIVGHLRLPERLPAPMVLHWAASITGKKSATPSARPSSRKAGAASSSTAPAPANARCAPAPTRIRFISPCSITCSSGPKWTARKSPWSAPASAATGRPSSRTWRRR